MTRNRLLALALIGGVSIAAAPVGAAEIPGEEAASVLVQPVAVKAIEAMSAYLRTVKQFRVVATTTLDDILDNGQLVEIAGVTTIAARLPDRLRVTVVNDKQERIYFYDGKTVTQFAPALDYYAVFDAPDTITKMLAAAQMKYGVELPLADLFYWAAPDTKPVAIEAAYFAGETLVMGDVCRHFAYRVHGADVQVWIRRDGPPLPCRLVITNIAEPARPQFGATLVWDTNAVLGEGTFAFAPPPGAGKIAQQPVRGGN